MLKSLISKDIYRHRFELLFLVTFELATLLSLAIQIEQLTAPIIMTLAFSIALIGGFVFSFRTVSSEDSNAGITFLLNLPLTLKEIVLSKFLVNWFLIIVNFVLVWGGALLYCIYSRDYALPNVTALLLMISIQVLNNSFYLAIALIFTSTKAIWIPFPLLLVAINMAINWQEITQFLPPLSLPPEFTVIIIFTLSLYMLHLTLLYNRCAIKKEWVK